MFERHLQDVVQVKKSDGKIYEGVKAGVQSNLIVVSDVGVPIEAGDEIIRTLPNGAVEKFIVTNPGYNAGIGSIKPHYQIKYITDNEMQKDKSNSRTTIYNLDGQNNRVNINSQDHSTNMSSNQEGVLFDTLKRIINKEVSSASEREVLLGLAMKMESCQKNENYMEYYKEFMSSAANHLTVLAPVLPALAALLA